MSEKSKPELILEIVKTLLWPVIIIVAVLWFGNDVKDMLKNRSFKIGLVEVGDRINNLEGSMQEELILQKDYLNLVLENATDSTKVREITNQALLNLEGAQVGIKKEIQNINNVVPELAQTTPEIKSQSSNQAVSAKDWEIKGFDGILERDIDEVINAFTEAEKARPDYHNVSEIRRLFIKNRDLLTDPTSDNWKTVYKKILEKYSWGMPANARQQMQEYINK